MHAHAIKFWLVWLLVTATPVWAVDQIVTVGGGSGGPNVFSPSSFTISMGDTVTFNNVAGGFHNVRSDTVTVFRCSDDCTSGAPSGSAWSAQITFNTPGTINYYCEIHGAPGSGMGGTITVVGTPITLESFEVE